jgi:hypothetical protein
MLISTYVPSHNWFEENNKKQFRGKYSFPIQQIGKVFEMNLNAEYFSNSTYCVSFIYQLANPLHLYNHPSRRLARSLHIRIKTYIWFPKSLSFLSCQELMGSQGKARYLTITVLLVTIILLSCPNLAVIARPARCKYHPNDPMCKVRERFPCKYDPKDPSKCHIGEPAAATKFDGVRS